MLQISKLTLTHKRDLRTILSDFNLVLNYGDKAVVIGDKSNRRGGRIASVHQKPGLLGSPFQGKIWI